MHAEILSAGILGIEAYPVEVQVDTSRGLEKFEIVGLPETSIKEGRTRIISALRNSGFALRGTKISVNLSPSSIKKQGALYDLPIALGILASKGVLKGERDEKMMVAGELCLDGKVKGVRGALLLACKVKELGLKGLILPRENIGEISGIDGVAIFAVGNLYEAVQFLNMEKDIAPAGFCDGETANPADYGVDFSDVRGQEASKRAIMVAVAGGHNIMMIGPPGSGKTMLARRIPTILPKMSVEERLEATKIHSVAGMLPAGGGLVRLRPFRSPHHTVSDAGMVGGDRIPRPGEMSLAHNGVLFLDEFSEFKKNVLEVMRQPLEEGRVLISRALGSIEFPARVMLVAAMNPCPCGYLGDREKECECAGHLVRRFYAKLSNPILDRIDIHMEVPRVDFQALTERSTGLSSSMMREAVSRAAAVQKVRFEGTRIVSNARMTEKMIEKFCSLGSEECSLVEEAMRRFKLSARGYSKILKLARTIADLDGSENIGTRHISEAIHYRAAMKRFEPL